MVKQRTPPMEAYIRGARKLDPGGPEGDEHQLWRSVEELEGSGDVRRFSEAEFSGPASPESIDRRTLLNLMTASLALGGLSGCAVNRQPFGAPLLSQPHRSPQHIPGVPLMFATSLELDGLGRGVLVRSHDGRPVKIEGNPLHPASRGATDTFAQSEVLSLYDPDRSKVPMAGGTQRSWADVRQLIARLRQQFLANGGRGLHILLQPCASPTRDRLIRLAGQSFPEVSWHHYSPLSNDLGRAASQAVFGRPVDQVFDLTQADVIVTFGGDLFGAGAGHVRYAADYAARRRATNRPLPNLYAVETTPSLTGARADRRLNVAPREVESVARQVLSHIRQGTVQPSGPQSFAMAIASDLARAGPRALVVAGREQPAVVQAIAHVLNSELGAVGTAVRYIEPLSLDGNGHTQSLLALAEAMASGRVEALLILGGNPAYEAPADIDFADLLGRVPLSVHLGTYRDETGITCRWHVPARHALESWGDLRAFDGTVGLRQPATVPMVEATTPEELLAGIAGEATDGHGLVQGTWRAAWDADFEARWLKSLEDGVVEGSAAPAIPVQSARWSPSPAEPAPPVPRQTIVFAPDPSVWDGRFANNGWLQELPKPLTKQVWGNAALMAPATAAAFGLRTGDVALFTHDGRSLEAPVWSLPGHAPDAVTMTLGYGRTAAGSVGSLRGFDAYRLRTSQQPWVLENVTVIPTGRRDELITTQHHHWMEGRDIVRVVAPGETPKSSPKTRPSLYPDFIYDGNAWGMAIDLDLCLGCNSCVIACQAENNVPIVGPEEVARGREMHWLRIDRYYAGGTANPETYFQPLPCMHCEKAPCEIVCPVNATVHSSEGLNEMVYSRCVGTRTCSNNCPYKVRRFNWFNYSQRAFAAPDDVHNPAVTVRWRGVMEKCTYCVQRISAARIAARMENRPVRDGEVTTACQQACPTRAIVFGNINDPGSVVHQRREDPRHYALLGELNTQPRTTYLARISNALPARAAGGADDDTG